MAGAGKGSPIVFVVVLAVVWVFNSFLVGLALYGSANGGTQKFNVVINPPDADSAAGKIEDELKTIDGLTVSSHEQMRSNRRDTGRFWACKEADEVVAQQYVTQLTQFKFQAVLEKIGNDVFVARLKEEFPDMPATNKAIKEVSQRTRLINLRAMPAVKLEQVKAVILEISVSGDDKVKAVTSAVNAKGLELIEVAQ